MPIGAASRATAAALFFPLLCACAATTKPPAAPAAESVVEPRRGEPAAATPGQFGDESPADATKKPLLDRTQQTVFSVVNNTTRWFDGFFGESELDKDVEVTRGLLAAGTQWDERDDFDNRLRLKARVPLPALKRRTSLILGRADAEDFVDGSASETVDSLPDRFNDFEDEDWLFGLGYSRDEKLSRGFDFDVGASISSSIEPFVRLSYRWNETYRDNWLWRLRPRVFWQEDRGKGLSLTSTLDYAVNPSWLLRSWTLLVAEDEIEGVGWTADFIAYHSVDQRNAFAYGVFASGETDNAVGLQDYGVELRYRRRILREWLFVELSTSLSWPREFPAEPRASNFGAGVEFEMQFGDWPGRPQERSN